MCEFSKSRPLPKNSLSDCCSLSAVIRTQKPGSKWYVELMVLSYLFSSLKTKRVCPTLVVCCKSIFCYNIIFLCTHSLPHSLTHTHPRTHLAPSSLQFITPIRAVSIGRALRKSLTRISLLIWKALKFLDSKSPRQQSLKIPKASFTIHIFGNGVVLVLNLQGVLLELLFVEDAFFGLSKSKQTPSLQPSLSSYRSISSIPLKRRLTR